MACSFCTNVTKENLHGILFPCDFDDRDSCQDGKVFIAKCDDCDYYVSDCEAAEVVATMTGWPMRRSHDRHDSLDADNKDKAQGKAWFRPYFAVTLKQVRELMDR